MLQSNGFQLITLGGLTLLSPSEGENAALGKQRRKLAVLAVLALSRRPVSRDTLIEMFWGDQEEARARHSLSEALSHLRRTLGTSAVTTRQADVALAEDTSLHVDAVEFAAAVEQGDFERALELYDGPFLDAVYVGGSPRFEEWTEQERGRLEKLFVRACDRRCELLAEEGRWEERAAVALRWLGADPLSAEAADTLLEALATPGTREADTRALREYDRLCTRLEREFELGPDPAVAARAERIRERLADCMAESPTAVSEEAPAHAAPTEPIDPEFPPHSRPPLRAGHRLRWAALALLVIAVAGALLVLRPERPTAAAVSSATVAVLPFAVHGADELNYLGTGLVDLLSTNLDGAGAFRSVDPRAVLGAVDDGEHSALTPTDGQAIAARVGAGLYILGDVVAGGGRVRISASLYDAGGDRQPLARASVEGMPADLFGLVDRLTVQLLAAQSRATTEQLTSIAALTTSSLPALKAYLRGESHYRAGRYVAAFESFQGATAQDSAFALAHYRLSQSGLWTGWGWDSIVDRSGQAVRHAGRLNRRTRLLVEAFHAWHSGAYDPAERLYRMVVATYPNDVEAWYQLAEVLFHSNPLRGRSFVESREPLERVLALEPDHLPAVLHLVRVAARAQRHAEVDSLVVRATALMPDQDELWLRAFRAFSLGGAAEQDAAIAELSRAPDEIVRISAERVAIYARNLEGAARILRLLVQPPRLPEARALGHVQLAELEIAHGRWQAAQPHLAAAAQLAPALAMEHRALLAALPFLQRPRAELVALRDTLVMWGAAPPPSAWPVGAVYDGLHPHLRSYLVGLLSIRLADTEAAERSARRLEDMSMHGSLQAREFARGLAESVRAHLAASRGRYADALAGLDRGRLSVSEGLLESPFGSQTYERFARAEALRALGRGSEALPWYGSIAETTLHQVAYLAPAHLRQGEINERLGRPRESAEHSARFLALWKDGGPALRAMAEEAQKRLARGQ